VCHHLTLPSSSLSFTICTCTTDLGAWKGPMWRLWGWCCPWRGQGRVSLACCVPPGRDWSTLGKEMQRLHSAAHRPAAPKGAVEARLMPVCVRNTAVGGRALRVATFTQSCKGSLPSCGGRGLAQWVPQGRWLPALACARWEEGHMGVGGRGPMWRRVRWGSPFHVPMGPQDLAGRQIPVWLLLCVGGYFTCCMTPCLLWGLVGCLCSRLATTVLRVS
jgi:hypothetical protein